MRATGPSASSHAHDHEWAVPDHGEPWVYEDGALNMFEECRYVEQRTAGHSARLDETFYETMYECDEERRHRFDLTAVRRAGTAVSEDMTGKQLRPVVTLADGREDIEVLYDEGSTLIEAVEQRAAERLTAGFEEDAHPLAVERISGMRVDTSDFTVSVPYRGAKYVLDYSYDGVTRL